jgi:Ca2+-binding EF-hand superfamily protein
MMFNPLLAITVAALPLATQPNGLNSNLNGIVGHQPIVTTLLESAQRRNVQSQPDIEFREMDRNGDGVITRAEWQGSAQEFRDRDWNGDGILSGEEVRIGAANRARGRDQRNYDRRAANDSTGLNDSAFSSLDRNGNGVIERREWNGNAATFDGLDRNRDGVLSRAEVIGSGRTRRNGAAFGTAATAGQVVRVDPKQRWTDAGITVRAGDVLMFTAEGTTELSLNGNDSATPAGAKSGRRAAEAPLRQDPAGALIARIGESGPIFVGDRPSITATASGRLYLGVNDDYLGDNTGEYRVAITNGRR